MKHFISIAEVQAQQAQQQQEAEGVALSWNINLPPHIDPERLHINRAMVRAVGGIAGFSEVDFNEHAGDKTAFEPPEIGGISGDSTAAAAGIFGRPKRAPTHNSSLQVTSGEGLSP